MAELWWTICIIIVENFAAGVDRRNIIVYCKLSQIESHSVGIVQTFTQKNKSKLKLGHSGPVAGPLFKRVHDDSTWPNIIGTLPGKSDSSFSENQIVGNGGWIIEKWVDCDIDCDAIVRRVGGESIMNNFEWVSGR